MCPASESGASAREGDADHDEPTQGRGFYDPLSEMNRLFDQMFGGVVGEQGEQRTRDAGWSPAIDVIQEDEDLVVRAELPGAKPEDVDITVHNGVLTISGKLEEEREEERSGYLVRERRSGSFRRSLQLPQDVDEDQIKANFENGVLEVKIPGAAAIQEPKRIQIGEPIGRRQPEQLADDFEDGKGGTPFAPSTSRIGAPCSPSRRRRRSGRMLLYRFSATDKTSPRGG